MLRKSAIQLLHVYDRQMKENKDCYPYLLQAVSRENVLPFTSKCNLNCLFCSHRQNPPALTTYHLPPLLPEEILELATFLSPQRKVIIGESATRIQEGEPFTHPAFIQLLSALRRKLPKNLISITTNGLLLTPSLLGQLEALSPLEITVSLNSVTASVRRLLLGDPEPERIKRVISALGSSAIPFHGSLVAMPHLVGMADIIETIKYLAAHGSQTIRLFLPGYTKYAPPKLRFPLELWSGLVELTGELTRELNVPVIPEPPLLNNFEPLVLGVIRGTPAQRAGIRALDLILSVNGRPARTRVEAFNLIREAANASVVLRRGTEELILTLLKEAGQPPGIVVHYDFEPGRLKEIEWEIDRRRKSEPLFLTSRLAGELLRQAVAQLGFDRRAVYVVDNNYFGGSIMCSGLLVVNDLLMAAKEALTRREHDIVLVPREAFDHKGRDLAGQNIAVLESALALPVIAL